MLRFVSFFLIVLVTFPVCAQTPIQPKITATVNKETVETGEIFTYLLSLEGEFLSPQLRLPDFSHFQVVSQSQSKDYVYKKGKPFIIFSLVYYLFAPEEGLYTIPAAVLTEKGTEFKSPEVTVKVEGKPLKEKRKIRPYIEYGIDL